MSEFQYEEHSFVGEDDLKAIRESLQKAPQAIYDAEKKMGQADNDYQKQKLTCTTREDGLYLTVEGKTVQDKKSAVAKLMEQDYIELLDKQLALFNAKAEYNKQVNIFAAVRKDAGLIEASIKAKL